MYDSDFTKTLFFVVAGLLGAENESLLSLFSSFSDGDLGLSAIKMSVPVCKEKQQHYNMPIKEQRKRPYYKALWIMKNYKSACVCAHTGVSSVRQNMDICKHDHPELKYDAGRSRCSLTSLPTRTPHRFEKAQQSYACKWHNTQLPCDHRDTLPQRQMEHRQQKIA